MMGSDCLLQIQIQNKPPNSINNIYIVGNGLLDRMVEDNIVQLFMELLRDQGLSLGEAIQLLRERGIGVPEIQRFLHENGLSVGELIQQFRGR